MKSFKVVIVVVLAILLVAVIAIQFVPVERSNPPAAAPLQAEGAVADVLRTSCYDCHSNETVWPWYAYVAPVSWLVTNDVVEARKRMNFSDWGNMSEGKKSHLAREIMEEVEEGKMPLPNYLKMHPAAQLTPDEVELIEQWTSAVRAAAGPAGAEPEDEEHEHDEHEHDEGNGE